MILYSATPSPESPGLFAVFRHGDGIQPTVECDGFPDRATAATHARNLTEIQEREQARIALQAGSIYERRIVAGFYTDKDAS